MLQAAQRHQAEGRLAQAETVCREILHARPREVEAYHLLGMVLKQAGRAGEAVEAFRQAVSLRKSSAFFRYLLGDALVAAKKLDEAEAAFRKALELEPSMSAARLGIGVVFWLKQQHVQAIEWFKGLLNDPKVGFEALVNLGTCLASKAVGRYGEAAEYLERAVRLRPQHGLALQCLGDVLAVQGKLDQAEQVLRRAIESHPHWHLVLSNLLFLLTHKLDDPAQLYEEHVRLGRQFEPAVPIEQPANAADPDRRLKVGYLSADFREHAVACFIEPVLENHDHSAFEVYCYSDARSEDAVTDRLRRLPDHWRDIRSLNNSQVVQMIRADQIDVLVDLAMHCGGGWRIGVFASKPAPVQVAYLAYAGTTGLPAMDWRLSDSYIDPPDVADAYSTERIWRLPDTQWVYRPPDAAPQVNPLPAMERGYITFGSVNKRLKITSEVLSLWCQILRRLPDSRLIMKARGLTDPPTQKLVLDELARGGVSADRVEFSGWVDLPEYFNFFHQMDIALDPYPFNGGTSTCHALWMGVPVVTRCGRTPASRVGLSVLSNVGLGDLVAHSPQQYIETAVSLAGDLNRLSNLRTELRRRMQQSPLCNAAGFTRSLEAAYRQMWRQWCQSVQPSANQ